MWFCSFVVFEFYAVDLNINIFIFIDASQTRNKKLDMKF